MDTACSYRPRETAQTAALDLDHRYPISNGAAEIGLRQGCPDFGKILQTYRLQSYLDLLELVLQTGIQDGIPHRADTGFGNLQGVTHNGKIVEHPHGVAQDLLGLQVRVRGRFRLAVRREKIMQIQRQGRMTIGAWIPMPGDLLIFQVPVFCDLIEIEIKPFPAHIGHGNVRRGNGHRDGVLHPIPQEPAEGGTNARHSSKIAHRFPSFRCLRYASNGRAGPGREGLGRSG